LDDIAKRLALGADKVTLNTQALETPEFITAAASAFGSQAILVSIDATREENGSWCVWKGGRTKTDRQVSPWAREAESRGAGEIFINSIDRDGKAKGYDLDLVQAVVKATTIPVIACGGAGEWSHFTQGLTAGAEAVAAGNLFHFKEMSYLLAKRELTRQGLNVRPATSPVKPFSRRIL
jgi:imidazole glycerol-phosphate synthase subunit HisF